MDETVTKTIRGYALEPEQRKWITTQALKATAERQVRVSDSEVLRAIIAKAMAKEAHKKNTTSKSK